MLFTANLCTLLQVRTLAFQIKIIIGGLGGEELKNARLKLVFERNGRKISQGKAKKQVKYGQHKSISWLVIVSLDKLTLHRRCS